MKEPRKALADETCERNLCMEMKETIWDRQEPASEHRSTTARRGAMDSVPVPHRFASHHTELVVTGFLLWSVYEAIQCWSPG